MKRKTNNRRNGFSLVELLTTIAVIGILLGLLVPALNMVGKAAAKVKQKAQFYAIGTALEGFRNDYGDYPPSAWDGNFTNSTVASHNLAEALIGRDGLGFHPRSQFQSDGLADVNGDGVGELIYDAIGGINVPGYSETPAENLAARRGPYLEIESANAVKLGNIDLNTTSLDQDGYVLVDMYKINRNTATGKEVGMPIMYYRANKMQVGDSEDQAAWNTNTYNINDSYCGSYGIINNYWWGGRFEVDISGNARTFYDAIANPNFPGPPARPYRAESFLLHSAGPDGLYGTGDDIFNFDQDN